jgi:hypothetical protein
MTVARRAAGLAYANLQWRKPREVWRGRASDAMGISAWAVYYRCALSACLGGGRRGDELAHPIAIGRTGVAQWRSNNPTVIQGDARVSLFIAGRETAKQKGRTGVLPRIDSDHDVSILITVGAAEGRVRGQAPRWKVSMMIMRPPQHGHGCESGFGLLVSLEVVVSAASDCAAVTSSKRRARATLSARVPLASSP